MSFPNRLMVMLWTVLLCCIAMGFLTRLVAVVATCAAVAVPVAASAVFQKRNKLLRLPSKIPADAGQVSPLNASVYELYSPPGQPSMEVLFFHGFQHGEYEDAHLSTWKCRDGSSIWPQTWLVEKFPDARILSVSYDASVIKSCEGGTIDMHLISENLTSDLLTAKIGQERCRPVVLVGHSFGGLVIKDICVYASSTAGRLTRNSEKYFQLTAFLENVKGIFFYSTPHQGVSSRIAQHFVGEGPLLEYVKTLSTPRARVNFYFDNLVHVQDGLYKMWQIAGVGESLPTKSGGFSGVVVKEGSARYGTSFNTVGSADHISVCRPLDKTCRSFSALTEFLQGVVSDSKAMVYGLPGYPTALESRVFKVQQKLTITPVLGIVGMGGIGKTTIAKELFNNISPQYEYTCFVENVKGMKVHELKDWVLNQFLRKGNRVDHNSLQWSHLQKKKSLIAMDDIDSESQVRILPRMDEFGSGSRLIFTTRDKGVLNIFPNCAIYDVEFLKSNEAKKLFCHHAFQQEGIPEDLTKVNRHLEESVKEVVEKCAGLPLTLEVLGCYLRDHKTNATVWKETLGKLRRAESVGGLDKDRVWSSLRVSYDALSPGEKGMFIEAGTCFFEEPVETAVAAWSTAFGDSESGWANLLRTSLVKEVDMKRRKRIKYKQVWVHEHLRDLANHLSKGAVDVVNANAVQVQTITLQFSELMLKNPSQMPEFQVLKYLQVRDLHEGCIDTLSRKLCLLKSTTFPTGVLPNSLEDMKKLRVLPHSLEDMTKLAVLQLEGWEIPEESLEALGKLSNLRILSLSYISGHSHLPDNFGHLYQLKRLELTKISWTGLWPSFGNLPHLKHLVLRQIPELVELPEAFGNLSSLASLVIRDCGRLASLPESFGSLSSLASLVICDCGRLARLPESFGSLSSLASLEIRYCGRLASLPESFGSLSSLASIVIRYCGRLASLPESFASLSSLASLGIHGCEGLASLPESFGNLSSLASLEISDCGRLASLSESFGSLSSLASLVIRGCEGLASLPKSFGSLSSLASLVIRYCGRLASVPESFGSLSSLASLVIHGCEGLASLPESFGNLSSLATLDILECDGLASLPESFGHLSSLKELRIADCRRLSCQEPTEVRQFGLHENLCSLTSLSLKACVSLERLPASFESLLSLQELELIHCTQLKTLPESIGQSRALTSLKIEGAENLEGLPESFGNLLALAYLHLYDCSRVGRLPESFGNLSALKKLDLQRCYRLRRLSANFGQLRALEQLTIRAAWELEALSDEFGNLVSLVSLSLSNCPSLVRLPESFGRLSALQELILGGCSKLARLPDNFGQLSALKTLRINGADELEELPDSLGNLSSLLDLVIRADRLQRVPVSVGQLQALKKLNVRAKMLKSLPEELGNLGSLETLRVVCCGNVETLPDSLGRMSSLRLVMLRRCKSLNSLPDSLGRNFWPHGDRSTATRRAAPPEHSCQIAPTDGFALHVHACGFLSDSVLQGLGWIQSDEHQFGCTHKRRRGRCYRRKCQCE